MKGKSKLPPKPFLVILGLMLVNVVIGLIGYGILATVSNLVVSVGALLYVVFIDSRQRWPDVPWRERFARVMTCYRD